MKDQVVLMSGGAGGIGQACAKRFKDAGAKVIILDLESERLRAIEKTGEYVVYACDLSDVSNIQAVVSQVVEEHGRIDALIQVAGLMGSADSLEISEEAWDRMFNINARGTFFLAQAVVDAYMKAHGGTIVNFSSAAAIRGFMGSMASAHYSASKAAIIALTRQLACEWGKYHVRVNAVVPGGVMTEAMQKMHFEASAFERIPLGALSMPEDIANAVYFLASPQARMITGQALVIDGGANLVGQ